MGFFDGKPTNSTDSTQTVSPDVMRAENSYASAQAATKEAISALGMAVYEAEKNNGNSDYTANIQAINKCLDNEKLWQQYRLSLDGKMKCEKCGAIITSDSAFCNKCGATITPPDFSSIGVSISAQSSPGSASNCPNCGGPIVEGAIFCEKCGTKLA